MSNSVRARATRCPSAEFAQPYPTRRARVDAERAAANAAASRGSVRRRARRRLAQVSRSSAQMFQSAVVAEGGGLRATVLWRGKAGVSAARAASVGARRIVQRTALVAAVALAVATTLPAQAVLVGLSATGASAAPSAAVQLLQVGAARAGADTARDSYSVTAGGQYLQTDASAFSNDPNGSVQWPFLIGVPITSGFGPRQVPGCSFCSTFHQGADFAPGAGTPVRVIADGVVTKVGLHDGGFGNDVWVRHEIGGREIVSVYGHLADGSILVAEGQRLGVGDAVGGVGSTGNSTGPHLHLEVHVDGTPVDPVAWLRANAN